jgi:hypothetical protein
VTRAFFVNDSLLLFGQLDAKPGHGARPCAAKLGGSSLFPLAQYFYQIQLPRKSLNQFRAGYNFVLLAGGGMKTGQVIGATDRIGAEAISRPVSFGELYATLYSNLGIDATRPLLSDIEGRPHFLVDDHSQSIAELG